MGFFSSDKPAPQPGQPVAGGALPRLADAKAKLESRDVPGAIAIYNEVLASAGARPDVLVAISGDLGSRGHVRELIELISPHYDAARHGPATGLNLLQAYLAVRNIDAAQHVLDILFSLNRPDLEERLFGFSNVIAELMAGHEAAAPTADNGDGLWLTWLGFHANLRGGDACWPISLCIRLNASTRSSLSGQIAQKSSQKDA